MLRPCRILATAIILFATVGTLPSVARSPRELAPLAEKGDAEAQYLLARACLLGAGVPKNPAKAWLLMKQAAAQGHPDAIGGMGYFYSAGVEVERDDAAAVKYFREGAGKGSLRALLNLGLVTVNGRGVPQDREGGLRMIADAAAQGLPEAMAAEGETWFYGQFGRGVDFKRALKHYLAAASAGLASAQNSVGVMYRDGQGVARDLDSALQWFRRAAEQGDSRGQSNLGHLLGVESPEQEKRVEALQWITLAADQNEITAVKTLEEASHTLREEVAIARLQANEFLQKRSTP